jgi:hypothetical protein
MRAGDTGRHFNQIVSPAVVIDKEAARGAAGAFGAQSVPYAQKNVEPSRLSGTLGRRAR